MAAIIESHTTATAGASTTTTLDIDAPAGIQSGDLLIIYASAGTVATLDAQPVGETGWTATDLTAVTYNEIWTYYKIAGASEPSTYTIDFNGSEYATLHMLRISGVDQTTPIEAQVGFSDSTTNPNPPSSGTSSTKAYLSLAFAAVVDGLNQDITGYPTGYTVISEEFSGAGASTNGLHTALTYKWENNTNIVDPGPFTISSASGDNTSTVVINSATTPGFVIGIDRPVVTPTLLPNLNVVLETQPYIRDYKSAGYVTVQTTVTVDAPFHYPGDLLFMLLSNSAITITATGPDGESGWTKGAGGLPFAGPDSDYYYKVAGASEPSTYTFTPGGGNDFTLHALAIANVHPDLANYGFTDTSGVDYVTFGDEDTSVFFLPNSSATVNRDKLGILYAVVDEGQQFIDDVGTVSNGWEVIDVAQGPTISSAYQSVLLATKQFTGTYENMTGVSFGFENLDGYASYNFAFTGIAPGPKLAPLTPAVLATPTVSNRRIGPPPVITPTLTVPAISRSTSPIVESTSTAEISTATTSLTIVAPVGIQDGDLLVAGVDVAGDTSAPSGPAGWTPLSGQAHDGGHYRTFYRVASSEVGNYTFTWAASSRAAGWMLRVSGADEANPISADQTVLGSGTTADPPASGTVAFKDYLSIAHIGIEGKSLTGGVSPSGYSTLGFAETTGGGNATGHCAAGYAYRSVPNVTSEDPGAFTSLGNDGFVVGTLLVLGRNIELSPLTPSLPLVTASAGTLTKTLPGPVVTPTLPLVTLNTRTSRNLPGPVVTPTLPLTQLFAPEGRVARIESFTTAATSTGGTITLDIDAPAGIQYGDLIYIIATAGTGVAPDTQPVGETGWTYTDLTVTGYNEVFTYYKIAGTASEPSTYTIDFNNTSVNSAIALRISGVDQTTPIEAQVDASGLTASPNPPSTGTLSSTKAYLSLVFAAIEDVSNNQNLAPPTNYLEVARVRSPSGGATGSSSYFDTQLAFDYEQNTNVYNPGSFSADVSDGWNAFTTAINSRSQASNFIVLPDSLITPTLPSVSVYKETQPFIRDYKSAITSISATTTTVTVDTPLHEPGDLIFLLLGANTTTITATGPDGESGWTKGAHASGNGPDSDYYYKVAGASEPSTYTFTPGPSGYFTLSAIAVGNVYPTLSSAFSDTLAESIEVIATTGENIIFDSNINETGGGDKLGLIWAVMDEGDEFTGYINSTSNGWAVEEIVEFNSTSTTYHSTFWGSKRFNGTYEDMSSVSFSNRNSDTFVSYNFAITGPPLNITLPGPITATLATPTLTQLNAVIPLAGPITPTLPLTTTSTGPVSRTLPGPLTPTLPLVTTSVGPVTSTLPGPITPTLETTTTSVGPVFINLTGPLTPTLSTVTTSVGPARSTVSGPVTPILPLVTMSTGPVSRTLPGPVAPSLPAVTVSPGAYTSTLLSPVAAPTLELITTSTGPVSRTLPGPIVPVTVFGLDIYRLISLAGGSPTTSAGVATLRVSRSIAWSFTDPVTYEYYDFEINPSSGGTPGLSKNIVYQSTAAASNKTIVMKRAAEPTTVSVQGTITTQLQLDTLTSWAKKRYPINLQDDLDREYLIYIESFDVRREPSSDTPYSHSYTLTYLIVG